ncbi:hypothetical protein BJ165DRAFT_734372 [Panaeolus papilionaceus]|nr:hypothetical protein BJ165DRAFT_734372 [Panaeolus papilionaceus]
MASRPVLTEADYYFPIGVVIQGVLHGIYTALFLIVLWIWRVRALKNRSRSLGNLISSILIILMWIVSCIHLGISIERLLRVFILELEVDSSPTYVRLRDISRRDNQVHMSLVGTIVGLGDILVTYRTYIVWNRNIWVVLVPVLIDVTGFVLVMMATYGLARPHVIPLETSISWYRPAFPLALLQNVLTTGLIWYKIWTQQRESAANGVPQGGRAITLGYLAQILVETALLYPLILLTIITLDRLGHPAVTMAIILVVPNIGIVFVLLTVRIHFASASQVVERSDITRQFPDWVIESLSDSHARSVHLTSNDPGDPPPPG